MRRRHPQAARVGASVGPCLWAPAGRVGALRTAHTGASSRVPPAALQCAGTSMRAWCAGQGVPWRGTERIGARGTTVEPRAPGMATGGERHGLSPRGGEERRGRSYRSRGSEDVRGCLACLRLDSLLWNLLVVGVSAATEKTPRSSKERSGLHGVHHAPRATVGRPDAPCCPCRCRTRDLTRCRTTRRAFTVPARSTPPRSC